jgi:hypothetical protein
MVSDTKYLTVISCLTPILFTVLLLSGTGVRAGENLPHHYLAAFGGWATESRPNVPDENGFAIGLEYGYRFHKNWGVGGVVEGLGQDLIRNVTLVVPVSWHPTGGGWRLFAGPGVEFTDTKDKFLVRIGTGYEFHFGDHWSLAPEIMIDYVEKDTTIWVGGLAVGYQF